MSGKAIIKRLTTGSARRYLPCEIFVLKIAMLQTWLERTAM